VVSRCMLFWTTLSRFVRYGERNSVNSEIWFGFDAYEYCEAGLMLCLQTHSCALLSSGGVKCWGDNYHGQVSVCVDFARALCLCRDVVFAHMRFFVQIMCGSTGSDRSSATNCAGSFCTNYAGYPCALTPQTVVGLGSGVVSIALSIVS
jgi:hypothetical protein